MVRIASYMISAQDVLNAIGKPLATIRDSLPAARHNPVAERRTSSYIDQVRDDGSSYETRKRGIVKALLEDKALGISKPNAEVLANNILSAFGYYDKPAAECIADFVAQNGK